MSIVCVVVILEYQEKYSMSIRFDKNEFDCFSLSGTGEGTCIERVNSTFLAKARLNRVECK